MRQLDKQQENELIKQLLVQHCLKDSGGLGFFSVLHFSDYDDYGSRLPWSYRSRFYNRTEVNGTIRFIRRLLKEQLKMNKTYISMERHEGSNEEIRVGKHLQHGDKREGKFHLNILLPHISEELLKRPHSKLTRLYGIPGEIPSDKKVELINRCFLKHPWIKRWGPSIKTQILHTTYDQAGTCHYSLKDITQKGYDFMDVMCFP